MISDGERLQAYCCAQRHVHVHTHTHPLLFSCSEVNVHRALLPVSHGTGSGVALWAMMVGGGGEEGSGQLPGSHMRKLATGVKSQ